MGLCTLVQSIQKLLPEASNEDVARMSLLLLLRDGSFAHGESNSIEPTIRDIQYRIQATSDQHAAVAEELEQLASSDPREFTADHIWTLIRAIKVQSQILEMYLDSSVPSTVSSSLN